MHKWLDNFGLDATYKCLLEIFVMAKHTEGTKALCRILKNRGETIHGYIHTGRVSYIISSQKCIAQILTL